MADSQYIQILPETRADLEALTEAAIAHRLWALFHTICSGALLDAKWGSRFKAN